jgi:tetratricopeptide (TPR) repeat protein
MGKKQARAGQHVLFCIAGLMMLLWGCSVPLNQWQTEEHLARSRYYLARGEFEAALAESRTALKMYPRSLGDQALFQIGLIHAHPENPFRDYRKAVANFEQMVKTYPGSRRQLEAETWIRLLGEIITADNQIEAQIRNLEALSKQLREERESAKKLHEQFQSATQARDTKIKSLNKKIEELQGSIDQLKEVDIKIEEKRRETSP